MVDDDKKGIKSNFPRPDLRDLNEENPVTVIRALKRFYMFLEEKVYPYLINDSKKIVEEATTNIDKRVEEASVKIEEKVIKRVTENLGTTKMLNEATEALQNITQERQKVEKAVEKGNELEGKLQVQSKKAEYESILNYDRIKKVRVYTVINLVFAFLVGLGVGYVSYKTVNLYQNTEGLRKRVTVLEDNDKEKSAKLKDNAVTIKSLEEKLMASEATTQMLFSISQDYDWILDEAIRQAKTDADEKIIQEQKTRNYEINQVKTAAITYTNSVVKEAKTEIKKQIEGTTTQITDKLDKLNLRVDTLDDTTVRYETDLFPQIFQDMKDTQACVDRHVDESKKWRNEYEQKLMQVNGLIEKSEKGLNLRCDSLFETIKGLDKKYEPKKKSILNRIGID